MWTSLLLIVIALAVFLLYVNSRPDSSTFERTIVIQAPADRIFPLINNMTSSLRWNPFTQKDPNINGELSGPPAGVGASYRFTGNNQVGSGIITITDSQASTYVHMHLQMTAPMRADNVIRFTLTPEEGGTRVVWSMQGSVPFMAKIMHTLMNIEKMIGRDFEAGLTQLKLIVERSEINEVNHS